MADLGATRGARKRRAAILVGGWHQVRRGTTPMAVGALERRRDAAAPGSRDEHATRETHLPAGRVQPRERAPQGSGETECRRDCDSRSDPTQAEGVPKADQPGESKQDQPRYADPPDPRCPVVVPQLHDRTLKSQAAAFPQETRAVCAICASSAYSLSGHPAQGVTAETRS